MTTGSVSTRRSFADALPLAGALVLRESLRHLPLDVAIRLGASIGRSYARLRGPRVEVAARNLELAFPEWSEVRRQEVLRESFANLGRGIAELCLLQGKSRDALLDRVRVEGTEHWDAARVASELGDGVILLTAHLGNWELAGIAMAKQGFPLSVIHREFSNPHIEGLVAGWRGGTGLETVSRGGAGFAVVRALKDGRLVGMLCDQNAPRREAVFAPFFGREASTRYGPVALAMRRGVPILPVYCYREGDGSRHVVRAEPALELEPAGSDRHAALQRNVGRMNESIEAAIRRAPDHWSWIHRRWRSRPEHDAEQLYPRRHRRRRRLRRALTGARTARSDHGS